MSGSFRFVLLFIELCVGSSIFSQSYSDPRAKEIDELTLAIVKHHLNDSFYLQMRPLPSVRFETRDYILRHDGKKWTASFSNKCLMNDGCVIKSQKIKTKEAEAMKIAQNIDIQRLVMLPFSDSINHSIDSLPIGKPSYFMIICSKGKVRTVEYPFNFHYDKANEAIFWHSDNIENILRELEVLSESAKLKHR